MRLSLCLSLLVVAIVVPNVVMSYRTARVSGDPHWTMFLGCRHDCQASGTFVQWTDDRDWVVLGHQRRCNPRARWAVFCMRSVATRIRDRINDVWAFARWGYFGKNAAYPAANNPFTGQPEPAEPARAAVTDNVFLCPDTAFAPITGAMDTDYGATRETDSETGQTCWSVRHTNIRDVKIRAFNGQYTVEYRGGLLYVDDEEGLVQFGWRGYFLTGRLHESVTGHGLMGYNSFRANENMCFQTGTGSNPHTGSMAGGRYNGAATQNWCTNYRLSLADPDNVIGTPLGTPRHESLMANSTFNDTADDITAAEVDLVGEPAMTTVDDIAQARAICAEIPTTDAAANEDCVFDVQIMEDKSQAREVGLSNIAAANTVQGGSSPSTQEQVSSSALAGIVVGSVVGAVALIAVGVLYVRLRHTKNELSRALVRVSGPTASSGVNVHESL